MTVDNMGSDSALSRFVRSVDRRTVVVAFSLYFLALFASVMPPFFQFVNRAEPLVFGLPFLLFWILFVGVMMSFGLTVLYWVEVQRGEVV